MHGLQNLRRNTKEKVGKRNREVGFTTGESKRIQKKKRNNRQYFRLETRGTQGTTKREEENVFDLCKLKRHLIM